MIKVSKLTDYAVVILGFMGMQEGEALPASALAERTRIPEPTVAKVLKMLSRGRIVDSVRGTNGGYFLKYPLDTLSIGDVIVAIDGPVSIVSCVDGSPTSCAIQEHCISRGRWDHVNEAIYSALDNVRLSDMVRPDFAAGADKQSKITDKQDERHFS